MTLPQQMCNTRITSRGPIRLPSPTTRDRGRVECDALFLSERALRHIFFVAGDNLEELISPLDDSPAHSVGVENEGICVAGHIIKLGTTEPRERLITWAVAHVCMYEMYVCIDIKSLPHIAWRLQLRSESWGITNKLIMRVRFETLSSSQSQKNQSHIYRLHRLVAMHIRSASVRDAK